MEEILARYGYVALFAGTFLEGETILIIAGFAAHQGYLKLAFVVLAAFLGTLAGDQLYFFLGRRKGKAFLERHPAWNLRVARASALFDRYQTAVVLGFRFMYGLRTVTPFAIGLSGISWHRFFFLNCASAFVWALSVALIGYLFGSLAEAALVHLKRYEHWVALGILCGGALVWTIHLVRRKKWS